MFKWLKSLLRRSSADTNHPDAGLETVAWHWHDLKSLRERALSVRSPRIPWEINPGDVIGPEQAEHAWVIHGGSIPINLSVGTVTLRHLICIGTLFSLRGPGRVIFEDCVFLDGTGVHQAMVPAPGTIDLRGGCLILRRCAFADNHGSEGGAIQTQSGSQLRATHCLFLNNRAEEDGGAVAINGTSHAIFSYCNFIGNVAAQGSAIACTGTIFDAGTAVLDHCVVIEKNNKEHRFLDDDQDPWGPWHYSEKPHCIVAQNSLLPPDPEQNEIQLPDNRYRHPTHADWQNWPHAVADSDIADIPTHPEEGTTEQTEHSWFGYTLQQRVGAVSNQRQRQRQDGP